ncbi:MAG: hypothetical protein WBW04_21115 [Nitrolancea sp.]
MAEKQSTGEYQSTELGTTLIRVPSDKVDAIMEFLASLDAADEEDVRGHMLGGGLLKPSTQTMTGGTRTGGPAFFEADYTSNDSDLA